ncbi:hypothetical protein RFI_35465, partial [Reticulomyxa filosa]
MFIDILFNFSQATRNIYQSKEQNKRQKLENQSNSKERKQTEANYENEQVITTTCDYCSKIELYDTLFTFLKRYENSEGLIVTIKKILEEFAVSIMAQPELLPDIPVAELERHLSKELNFATVKNLVHNLSCIGLQTSVNQKKKKKLKGEHNEKGEHSKKGEYNKKGERNKRISYVH